MEWKKQYIKIIGKLLVVVFLYLAMGCDTLDNDQLPESQAGVESVNSYIFPGNAKVIDLSKGINATSPLTVSLVSKPEKGSIKNLEGSIFKYQPLETFKEGEDSFYIDIFNDENKLLLKKKVSITVTEDSLDFPCETVAFPDSARIMVNSQVEIDVLDNDWVCNGETIDPASLALKINPANGTAKVEAGKIHYTPNQDFKGTDEFVYTVNTIKGDSPADGLVTISVDGLRVNNDYFVFSLDSIMNLTELKLNVLDNDNVCGEDSEIELIGNPKYGTARIEDQFLLYQPDAKTALVDSMRYQVCCPGISDCGEALVVVRLEK